MRGVFAVDDPNGPRWAVALELLATGKPFQLGQVTFRRLDPQTVEAAVASSWQLENVTEERARSELDAARARVDALLSEDAEFHGAIDGSTIEYLLVEMGEHIALMLRFLAPLVVRSGEQCASALSCRTLGSVAGGSRRLLCRA